MCTSYDDNNNTRKMCAYICTLIYVCVYVCTRYKRVSYIDLNGSPGHAKYPSGSRSPPGPAILPPKGCTVVVVVVVVVHLPAPAEPT